MPTATPATLRTSRAKHAAPTRKPAAPAAARLRHKNSLLFPVLAAGLIVCGLTPAQSAAQAAFFPLLSLTAQLLLLRGVQLTLQLCGVRFGRFRRWVLALCFAGAALYLWCFFSRREFIYYWDYNNYLVKQYEAEAAFSVGTAKGLALLGGSLADDYTSFINLFTEFPFCFTAKTGNAYVVCQLISVFPSLLLMLGGLVVRVGEVCARNWPPRARRRFFALGMALCLAFPFLRVAALLGQPDWLGLVFALGILLLTLEYRFEQVQPLRWALLFLYTAALVLTRRWYLYFIVAYYACYAAVVLAHLIRLGHGGKAKCARQGLTRLVGFGLASLLAMLWLFRSMVAHIATYDYALHYVGYNAGGFALELGAQILRLFPFYLILLVLGIAYAVRRRQYPLLFLGLATPLLSMLLFTRVQNMWSHQTLLLLPGELLLFLLGAAALVDPFATRAAARHMASRRRGAALALCVAALVCGIGARISPMTLLALPGAVIDHLPLEYFQMQAQLDNRDDWDSIRAVAAWLAQHCDEDAGETAYVMPHNELYNPDLFRFCELPDQPLENVLSRGFDVLGTNPFPTELFDAKYVLTCTPFPTYNCVSGLSIKLNDMFLLLADEYFTPVEEFDMGNGTVFTVYERTRPADAEEVAVYRAAFTGEDAQFPELYSQVLDAWCAENGIDG
jgi:hypothetical protein